MRDEGAWVSPLRASRALQPAGKKSSEGNALLQGFSGLEILQEVEAWGQGSSGKSGCINRVKSSAPGEEDHFLQTHGVT